MSCWPCKIWTASVAQWKTTLGALQELTQRYESSRLHSRTLNDEELPGTVLLKSDGTAVAFGDNSMGECDVPTFLASLTDTQAAHTPLRPPSLPSFSFSLSFLTVPLLPAGASRQATSRIGEVVLRKTREQEEEGDDDDDFGSRHLRAA